MKWFMDRWKEDNTRSAIVQIVIMLLVLASALGFDVDAALAKAQSQLLVISALVVTAGGIVAAVMRIVTAQSVTPPIVGPVISDGAMKGLEKLAETQPIQVSEVGTAVTQGVMAGIEAGKKL